MPLSNAERQRRHRQRTKERPQATLGEVIEDCYGFGVDDDIDMARKYLAEVADELVRGGWGDGEEDDGPRQRLEGDRAAAAKSAGAALKRVLGDLSPLAGWTYGRLMKALDGVTDDDWKEACGDSWKSDKDGATRFENDIYLGSDLTDEIPSNIRTFRGAMCCAPLLRHKGLIT